MRLNLGAGENATRQEGWLNVDLFATEGIDLVHDIADPLPFENESVEEIFAGHVLEHVFNGKLDQDIKEREHFVVQVLRDWVRVLKPGCVARIYVPDILLWADMALRGVVSIDEYYGAVYGADGTKHMRHVYGFTYDRLERSLLAAGFREVKRLDRKGDWPEVKEKSREELQDYFGEPDLSGHIAVEATK